MWQLPTLPPWDAMHPLVIHFPIVLTLLAPLVVMLAIPNWRYRWAFAWTAAGMMLLGTVFVWVAVSTGEAAGELATRTPDINRVLETHEELAEFTAWWLTGLTVGYLIFLGVMMMLKKQCKMVWIAGCLIVLACQGVGMLAVANTAHNGGRLVHEFGVHALLPPEPLPGTDATGNATHKEDDAD